MPRRELDSRQREENVALLGSLLDEHMQLDPCDPEVLEKEVCRPQRPQIL